MNKAVLLVVMLYYSWWVSWEPQPFPSAIYRDDGRGWEEIGRAEEGDSCFLDDSTLAGRVYAYQVWWIVADTLWVPGSNIQYASTFVIDHEGYQITITPRNDFRLRLVLPDSITYTLTPGPTTEETASLLIEDRACGIWVGRYFPLWRLRKYE